jgi:hypothetical protein
MTDSISKGSLYFVYGLRVYLIFYPELDLDRAVNFSVLFFVNLANILMLQVRISSLHETMH